MELETLSYHRRAGWSVASFPQLDSERTLVLVFAAPVLVRHPEPLAALVAAYPKSSVLGCSTAGEIGGPLLRDDSLCAAVVRLGRGALRQVLLPLAGDDATYARQVLARELQGGGLRAVLLFADAPRDGAAALVEGLSQALPSVPIVGALAADGQGDDRGWIIGRGPPARATSPDGETAGPAHRRLISAVGLYGDELRVSTAVAGPPGDAEGPPGEAAEAAATLSAPPGALTLAFGCVSRRLILGAGAERELEAIWAARGAGRPALLGCYSHGTIGGGGGGGDDDAAPAELREGALVLLRLGEVVGDAEGGGRAC